MDQEQRLESVDWVHRDKISLSFGNKGLVPDSRTGTIFNRGSASPYDGNVRGDNWPCNSLIRMIAIREKAMWPVSRLVTYGSEPPVNNPKRRGEHNNFMQELFENLFITLRVNAKEYLSDVPVSRFPDFSAITTMLDWLMVGGGNVFFPGVPSVRQISKTGSGGLILPVPIEVAHGDSVQIEWKIGETANMPSWEAAIGALSDFFFYDYTGTARQLQRWYLDLEVALFSTDRRIVQ